MANCELYLNEEHQERLRKMAQEQKQTLTAEEAEAARQKEEQLRNSLRELSQHTAKMRSYQVLFDELAEGIDEAIIALVLKKHPYILEAKGNRVRELQYMLVDYTPELTKEILEFLLEIKQEMKGDTA
jgi:soluble cytochrome b562